MFCAIHPASIGRNVGPHERGQSFLHYGFEDGIPSVPFTTLVCRINENVMPSRCRFITPVNEMIWKLKARYTGARRPVERMALKLFRMRRESGETPQRFAYRLDAALRTLKERAVEEWGATAAAPKIAAYEGVARETLMAEMPDKVRR
ncbi:hypothetical protein AAG570_012463 [Ranatra chinensis]|uniref:Uncharacterized protein n=1 Tax=Ranatra chinensis TaxID=642074 RepID=A0ABD0Z072_9HEMI